MSDTQHRLFTWSWRAALDYDGDDIVLVRISVGKPKWLHPAVASAFPYIAELAPQGCFHLKADDAFRGCYLKRLADFGAERIERRFQTLRDRTGGLPLVLLCYENHPSQCHRGDFAEWWLKQTGELVPEFAPRTTRDRPAPPAPGLF